MAVIPRKLRRRQSGQALVEFALVLLFVILPIMIVFVNGAMLLFTLASMTNAAREAAHSGSIYQYGAYTTSFSTIDAERYTFIVQKEKEFASPLIPFEQCKTTVTYNPDPPTQIGNVGPQNVYRALDSMSVALDCPHRLLFGIGSLGSLTLTAQSTMRIEPGGAPITVTTTFP